LFSSETSYRLENCDDVSLSACTVTQAEHVVSEMPNKERYPAPLGRGLGVDVILSPLKSSTVRHPAIGEAMA